MGEKLIELKDANKYFDNKLILENINLSIRKGETLAILGHNGSGKSTLLRMIAGLSSLSSGERKVYKNTNEFNIGYVPEHFYKLNFTPYEYLYDLGKIRGLTNQHIIQRINKLINMFNLYSLKDTLIKYLSKGTIQKISFIQSILIEPDILLLDEPISGQDDASQDTVIEILSDFKQKGIAVVLACHEKYLVNKLADKIAEINNNRLFLNSYPLSSSNSLMLICFKPSPNFSLKSLNEFEKVENMQIDSNLIKLSVSNLCSDVILMHLLQNDCKILSVRKFTQNDEF